MKRFTPFLCVSLAIHVFAFVAFALIARPESSVAGSSDGDPDRVFVTVHSEQDFTPVLAISPT